jgi:hypothetical protein
VLLSPVSVLALLNRFDKLENPVLDVV